MSQPMDTTLSATQPPTQDADLSDHERDLDRLAYESLAAALAALTTFTHLNTDLARAGAVAIQAAQGVCQERAAVLAKMPPEFLDPAHISGLEAKGRAARFVGRKLRQAKALGDDLRRRLPADVTQGADTLRAQMLRVLDYNAGDQAIIARQLAAIRSGSGYQDLANDLDDLADLYETLAPTLARDTVHYRADDAPRARAAARVIIEQLDLQRRSDITHWIDQQRRVWTLLALSYNEVRAAVHFIWRHDAATCERLPSLRQTSSSSSSSSSSSTPAAPSAPAPAPAP
jgi:hypothetical protein